MDITLGDSDVNLGQVADAGKTASNLLKTTSLPGATSAEDAGKAEPEICPTCNQKIVTTQPGMSVEGATKKADNVAASCGKCFDCFGKGLDQVERVQGMTGGE